MPDVDQYEPNEFGRMDQQLFPVTDQLQVIDGVRYSGLHRIEPQRVTWAALRRGSPYSSEKIQGSALIPTVRAELLVRYSPQIDASVPGTLDIGMTDTKRNAYDWAGHTNLDESVVQRAFWDLIDTNVVGNKRFIRLTIERLQ